MPIASGDLERLLPQTKKVIFVTKRDTSLRVYMRLIFVRVKVFVRDI